MRVENLQVKQYGILRNWQVSDLPAGVVIFYGPNEAGKSTLFDLLTSLFYGFSPATIAKHPYMSWYDYAPLNISAGLMLRDNRQGQVHRRLLPSGPQGTFRLLKKNENSIPERIGNRALAFVQHIRRDLYQALYALSVYDFKHLEDKHRDEIQDCLLGDLTTARFHPVKKVLSELQEEANKLWRVDRRGSPKHKELSTELRDVQKERKEAIQRENELRDDIERLDKLKNEWENIRQKRAELKARIRRAEILQPVAQTIKQLEHWQQEIGNLERLDKLPVDLAGELQRLLDEGVAHREELANLAGKLTEQDKIVKYFGDFYRQVLENSEEIQEWVRLAEFHDREQQSIEAGSIDLQQKLEELETWAETFMSDHWSDQVAGAVLAVPYAELKVRFSHYDENKQEHIRCRQEREQKENNVAVAGTPVFPAWINLAGFVAALLLIIVGEMSENIILTAAGVALLVLFAGALGYGLWLRQINRQVLKQYHQELERLRKKERQAIVTESESQAKINRLLAGIPLMPSLLEQIDSSMLGELRTLRDKTSEWRELANQLKERNKKWQVQKQRLKILAEKLNELLDRQTRPMVERLNAKLEQARQAKDACNRAQKQLIQINHRRDGIEKKLQSIEKDYQQLVEQVIVITGKLVPVNTSDFGISCTVISAELQETIDIISEKQKILRLMQHHEQELQQQHANLTELKKEIIDWQQDPERYKALDPVELEKDKNSLEDGEKAERDLHEEILKLETKIEIGKSKCSPGELDGEIQLLKEQQQEISGQRDRLMLMKMVLQRAEHEFRIQHQPDVLRRSGEYLKQITGGRYSHLMILDAKDGDEHLAVQPTGSVNPLPVGIPLSRGTLDQIFLSFRLAVIDHLDSEHERLPLFLDEILVNWDDARLLQGVDLLGKIANKRQVFLFTCRQAMAKLASQQLKVPIFSVDDCALK